MIAKMWLAKFIENIYYAPGIMLSYLILAIILLFISEQNNNIYITIFKENFLIEVYLTYNL